MISIEDALPPQRSRPVGYQFLCFCTVGAVGFVVDAGLLVTLLWTGWFNPINARFLSFSCAVTVTFLLNRHWSFKENVLSSIWPTFAAYLGVQGIGFLCNLSIYTLLYLLLPAPANRPFNCLVTASAISMVVNYLGVRILVFRSRLRGQRESVVAGAVDSTRSAE